jgi:hypothetical protein
MKTVIVCTLITLTGCLLMVACASYTSQQPGGVSQTYRGPSNHIGDISSNSVANKGNEAFNQALGGCAALATQNAQKNQGKVFQYKVTANGGCEVLIINDGGEESMKGIFENRAKFDIILTIKLSPTESRQKYVPANSWTYLFLLPGEYEAFVQRASNGKYLYKYPEFKVDAFSKNAYSTMAQQQVAFVAFFKY